MRILSHYFVARFFGLFLTTLVVAVAIIATIELVLNLEELSAPLAAASGPGRSGARLQLLEFLGTRLATIYLVDLLPVASFVASFVTFALAGRRLEWIAIEACGVRPIRILLPVLTVAALLSGVAALLHETVVLPAERARLAEDQVDRDEIDLERRGFWYHRGPIITNIGRADPAERTLHDVEVFERGMGEASGHVRRIVRARDVRILADGTWHFERAAVWDFDPANPLAEPRFAVVRGLELDLHSVPRNTLAQADPAILPIRALARYLGRESPAWSSGGRRLAEVYHERLSRPWRVLALCWVALPFGLRVDRRGRIAPAAAAALVALAAFFLATSAGATLTRIGLLPVALASWGIPLAFASGAALALARRRA